MCDGLLIVEKSYKPKNAFCCIQQKAFLSLKDFVRMTIISPSDLFCFLSTTCSKFSLVHPLMPRFLLNLQRKFFRFSPTYVSIAFRSSSICRFVLHCILCSLFLEFFSSAFYRSLRPSKTESGEYTPSLLYKAR